MAQSFARSMYTVRLQVNKIWSGSQQRQRKCNLRTTKLALAVDCRRLCSILCTLLFSKMSLLRMDGSTYQGHRRFSSKSRGKQCAFMSLSALLTVPRAQGTGEIRNAVNGLMQHFILR